MTTADVVSKATHDAVVAQLKASDDAKNRALSELEGYNARARAELREMQGEVQQAIKGVIEGPDGSAYKADLMPMASWGENIVDAADTKSTTSMARLVTCFSAGLKRERANASANSDAAQQLADTNKKLDEMTADRDNKAMRVGELEQHVLEKNTALEKMEKELRASGLMRDQNNFSLQTSRENNSAASAETAASSNAAGKAPMATKPAAVDDALFSHVIAAGRGGNRIGQSGSQHHFLGGSNDQSIAEAVRSGIRV